MTLQDPPRNVPPPGPAQKTLAFIVDDEPDICALLTDTMTPFAMEARVFSNASDLLAALETETPDVCVVDLGLPDMEGMHLINEIRKTSSVPILVLSARGHSSDRVMGLELGADDYVVKPFDPREVVARIRSILRRSGDSQKAQSAAGQLRAQFSRWTYSPQSQCLTSDSGDEIYLPTGEAHLLEALIRAPKRVLSRDYLLEHGGRDDSLDRSIDVRISRIRKRLSLTDEPELIRTVYGAGYMFTGSVDWV